MAKRKKEPRDVKEKRKFMRYVLEQLNEEDPHQKLRNNIKRRKEERENEGKNRFHHASESA